MPGVGPTAIDVRRPEATSGPAAAGNPPGIIAAVPRSHVRATMHRDAHGWIGRLGDDEVRAKTRDGCVSALRRLAGEDAALVVQETPDLVGVSEAAEILGWDRRRVATYVGRGAFPPPLASLASGRVWRREDVSAFGRDRARRKGRRIPR
jgi:hypothetical protein